MQSLDIALGAIAAMIAVVVVYGFALVVTDYFGG